MPSIKTLVGNALTHFVLPVCLLFAGSEAHALLEADVVEFYNLNLDHYFMTADPQEIQAVEAGMAGSGWVKTGYAFVAYFGAPGTVPVSRFHGTPGSGSDSYFYTADPAEAEGLKHPGSGWTFEREAFSIRVPDSAGNCASGLNPVFRLYNNRWMFNDSNHRYVTNEAERQRMRAKGWIDEGARFCAYTLDIPLTSFSAHPLDFQAIHLCEAGSVGPCLAINNLPIPGAAYSYDSLYSTGDGRYFGERTGLPLALTFALVADNAPAAALDVFVQINGVYGLHLLARGLGASPYSSMIARYQFKPGAPNERFYPWVGRHESDVQLRIFSTLEVKRVSTSGPGDNAYGHPTVEFVDQASGHHLLFGVLAYGTMATPGDFVAPDVTTRQVIVGTTFRDSTPFGRSLGSSTLKTPSGFVSEYFGSPLNLDFRIDRLEFQRIVDAARAIDPMLSSVPEDYFVDSFQFKNEIVGAGEIGLHLDQLELQLVRRLP